MTNAWHTIKPLGFCFSSWLLFSFWLRGLAAPVCVSLVFFFSPTFHRRLVDLSFCFAWRFLWVSVRDIHKVCLLIGWWILFCPLRLPLSCQEEEVYQCPGEVYPPLFYTGTFFFLLKTQACIASEIYVSPFFSFFAFDFYTLRGDPSNAEEEDF